MERHLKDTPGIVLERGSKALSGGGDLAWVRFARVQGTAGRSYEGVWMAARNGLALRLVRRQIEEDDKSATEERDQVRRVAESLELLAEAQAPGPEAVPASLSEIRNLLLPRLVTDSASAVQSLSRQPQSCPAGGPRGQSAEPTCQHQRRCPLGALQCRMRSALPCATCSGARCPR